MYTISVDLITEPSESKKSSTSTSTTHVEVISSLLLPATIISRSCI
ncbi:unnamed protein product [Amoebophrya sp. A25]|nr:unnamed protein product [Amoebophrya sp. A25]|eukprot:GSA25T00023480001.1